MLFQFAGFYRRTIGIWKLREHTQEAVGSGDKKGKGMDLRLLIQRDDVRLTFSQDFKVPYKPILDSEVERRRD